ncbi:MAG TPA: DUF488 family protein [Verrucomicrobiae bacterium]|nr:DUF488 family protein [Verrucomicrobiae bacterium]
MIRTKRVYEPVAGTDGKRFLVDRLWPRGVKKKGLQLSGWIKEVAPSNSLRRWFNHDPDKWVEFQRRYRAELAAMPESWQPLLEAAKARNLTLLFGAQDLEHNNAVVLKTYLDERLKGRGGIRSRPFLKRKRANQAGGIISPSE